MVSDDTWDKLRQFDFKDNLNGWRFMVAVDRNDGDEAAADLDWRRQILIGG